MKNILSAIFILVGLVVKAQDSEIIGNWQLTQVEVNGNLETDLKAVFVFEEKGILKAARDAESKTINAGTWTYNNKKKTIEMHSELDKDFNGLASVVKVNKNELVYKKDGAILSFIKLAHLNSPPKIEMEKPLLSFKESEFVDEEGWFNEEEEAAKLPWKIAAVVDHLKNVNEVVFTVTSFPDTGEAESWVESTKISFNQEDKTLEARDYSYVQKDYIDMVENLIPLNVFEEYKDEYRFFPEDVLNTYKVVATNKIIKTAIGEFECTLVDGFGSYGNKIQYWMINNQPGVFAKIVNVRDEESPFGVTNVYSLKEIK